MAKLEAVEALKNEKSEKEVSFPLYFEGQQQY
jgi:hypothetical protein